MQSIIVYRNPAQAAVWEALSSWQLIPIIMGGLAFVAAVIALQSMVDKLTHRICRHNPTKRVMTIMYYANCSVLPFSAVIAFFVIRYFWLG